MDVDELERAANRVDFFCNTLVLLVKSWWEEVKEEKLPEEGV